MSKSGSAETVRDALRRAFDEYAQLRGAGRTDGRYYRLRDRLIVANVNLVHFLAARFIGRGENFDDLVQVGMVGLLKAIDRYEPQRGYEFSTYATPTIVGEIRRHFRDAGWSLHVPRRLRELAVTVTRAEERMTAALARTPTIGELADDIGLQPEEILEALELLQTATPLSIESADLHLEGSATAKLAEKLAVEDEDFSLLEDRVRVEGAMQTLSGRERIVVQLRFFDGLSQAHVAERLDVSQMQISRLQHRALEKLRNALEE